MRTDPHDARRANPPLPALTRLTGHWPGHWPGLPAGRPAGRPVARALTVVTMACGLVVTPAACAGRSNDHGGTTGGPSGSARVPAPAPAPALPRSPAGGTGSGSGAGTDGGPRQAGTARAFVVVAAGDIATTCPASRRRCGHRQTADRVAAIDPPYVITLGDNQYDRGTLREYRTYYDRTWGRFKSRTRPVPGNHEYAASSAAAGYKAYFGPLATPAGRDRTWYAWNQGGWHFIALDSDRPMNAGSGQLRWLAADLAANRRRCVAAYWHHPRFSSGLHGSEPRSGKIWQALYGAHTELVLGGHDHSYERFGPQTPAGRAAATGIREIVVGTGGGPPYAFGPGLRNSVKRITGDYAVLALTLTGTGYSGRLIRADGEVLDRFGPLPCR